jgi:alpha-galactosidase
MALGEGTSYSKGSGNVWFGERNSDNCSLGDWNVNENKITKGLKHLVDCVNEIGLEFGIWFELEMISPNSELYRAHPECAIQIPKREATQSREQYVLDLANPEVLNYAYESVAKILRCAPIFYVKWDINRQLSDLGSAFLDKESQQELFYLYVLGVYQIQERLIKAFPKLLLENCSEKAIITALHHGLKIIFLIVGKSYRKIKKKFY